jgi:hypothetical protein
MRRITSSDLPQADRLESVLLTVIAVGNGARTDIEIANQIPSIAGDDRQGRYYRNAAEKLGFISNQSNNATLLQKGQKLLLNPTLTNPLFISSVLNLEVYQKLLPYMELHPEGLAKQEIQDYLQSIADPKIGPSMIPRRISTILAWPKVLGFLRQTEDGRLQIQNNLSRDIPVFEIQDVDQPLLPVTGDLSEYHEIEQRTSSAKEEVVYFKDQAKLERATNSHIALVNLASQRIRQKGGIPKSNQLIDLAVRLDRDYIFEMKSSNDDNVRSQVRKGMSQLYEYRYLQNKPEAKLILVIESPLRADHLWMLDYMETDRDINLVWDGNNELYGSERTRNELSFLGLQSK